MDPAVIEALARRVIAPEEARTLEARHGAWTDDEVTRLVDRITGTATPHELRVLGEFLERMHSSQLLELLISFAVGADDEG